VARDHTAATEDPEGEVEVMEQTPLTLDELSCPICFKLMTDPVVAEDGQTYQRQAIEQWINKCITGNGAWTGAD
jgi:hypothetical protein